MRLGTLNVDSVISLYKAREVTTHNLTGTGSLFDPDIFGDRTEKALKFGYIKLGGKFLDMSTYRAVSRVWRDIQYIVENSKKYIIDKDGRLVPDSNGGTGIKWFYDNFDKISFKKVRDSLEAGQIRMQSKLMKKAVLSLKKEDFFIDKLLVLPLRYRDINNKGGNIQLDEINQLYVDLIKLTDTKKRFSSNSAINSQGIDFKIQNKLLQIFDWYSDRIFGKTGAQRAMGLTRAVDNAAGIVIVSPEIRPSDTIGKTMFSLDKINTPLHHVMNQAPIHTITQSKKVLNFLREAGVIRCTRDDFDFFYTNEFIQENMEYYSDSPGMRLHSVPQPNGEPIVVYKKWTNKEGGDEVTYTKPLSWLELFSLCMPEITKNTRNEITRFPVTSKASKVFGKTNPLTLTTERGIMEYYTDSTMRHFLYKLEEFPDVDHVIETVPKDMIPSYFEEATKFSNLYLDGLNGDYDGDRIKSSMTYSTEAKNEIDDFLNSPIAHLNIDGSNLRNIGNEGIQGLWNLTTNKRTNKMPKLSKEEIKELDDIFEDWYKKKDITLKEVIYVINKYHPEQAYTYRFRGRAINTTIGRVVFNIVVFGHLGEHHDFMDLSMTKKEIENVLNKFSNMVLDDSIKWYSYKDYLDIIQKVHDLGFGICDIVASSLDYDMLIKNDEDFNKVKNEFLDTKGKDLNDMTADEWLNKENKVIDYMKNKYRDNQMADMYDSGAKPAWNKDLKVMKVSIGVTPVPGTSNTIIIDSNLKEGIKTKDILPNANLQIEQAYSRAVSTAEGGYLTKRMYNAFQSTLVYKRDCGVKKYLKATYTDRNELLYRYAKHPKSGEVVQINSTNVDEFLNKEIEIRSPIYCKDHDGFCSHCTGEKIFRLYENGGKKDIKSINLGLFFADIGNEILNKFMKKVHDISISLYTINDLDDFIV